MMRKDSSPHDGFWNVATANAVPGWLMIREQIEIGQISEACRTNNDATNDVTDVQPRIEDVQFTSEQLWALEARVQHAREEERKRVAREIHDELGQVLTAIKLDLSSWVRELSSGTREPHKRGQQIATLVDEAIRSVRRIATELRPGILDDMGLIPAVAWAMEEFQNRTGTKCFLDVPTDPIEPNPEQATALFRVCQETLTNIARHAGASAVVVRLEEENGTLILEVRDNGNGFEHETALRSGSLGIMGMKERVLLLGGDLRISSILGKGTTVSARIPSACGAQPQWRGDGNDHHTDCR
ncbi:MAG: sensor histidine kinase [Candidatus Korobacteraceae bacterium]